jgi:ABC-type lipoprotein release transport system permease subunit
MLLLAGTSLLGIVLGAAIVPAMRAARIEPATALRID